MWVMRDLCCSVLSSSLSLSLTHCVSSTRNQLTSSACAVMTADRVPSQSLPDSPMVSSTDRSLINSFICTVHPLTLSQVVWVLSHRQVVLVQVPAVGNNKSYFSLTEIMTKVQLISLQQGPLESTENCKKQVLVRRTCWFVDPAGAFIQIKK